MRQHVVNLVKYVAVGGAATVVDFAIFGLFANWLEFNYLLVGSLGFVFATGFNYLLCVKYVYQSGQRFSARGELLGVYLVSGVGLTLHVTILYTAHEFFDMHLMLSKVVATGMVFFWNFGIRNFYLFASPSARGRPTAPRATTEG
jgi:putative flippase GtrA